MNKVSGPTSLFKFVLPLIWFSFVGYALWDRIQNPPENAPPDVHIQLIGLPLVFLMAGLLYFRFRVWDLVDEVFDNGRFLEFHSRGKVQKVPLDQIVNVSSNQTGPERVTVQTREPGPLGNKLVFTPKMRFSPFSENAYVNDLIRRVDNARNT